MSRESVDGDPLAGLLSRLQPVLILFLHPDVVHNLLSHLTSKCQGDC
jgi:hypothetical protein